MKKFKNVLVALAAGAAVLFHSGCTTLPTAEGMAATASAVGAAAGLIAGQTQMDEATRTAVVAIVGEVSSVTPVDGKTFAETWTPYASEKVAKLVEGGKLDAGSGEMVLAAFGVAVKGMDYLLDRYPEVKGYADLVAAAVSGFTNGFLATFGVSTGGDEAVKVYVDGEAYEWLKAGR